MEIIHVTVWQNFLLIALQHSHATSLVNITLHRELHIDFLRTEAINQFTMRPATIYVRYKLKLTTHYKVPAQIDFFRHRLFSYKQI